MAFLKTSANFIDSVAIFEFSWNSMLTSASGRCQGLILPSGPGMPWSHIIMSCCTMPSQRGSSFVPCSFCPLRDVGVGAAEAALLAVPQREANRLIGGDVRDR